MMQTAPHQWYMQLQIAASTIGARGMGTPWGLPAKAKQRLAECAHANSAYKSNIIWWFCRIDVLDEVVEYIGTHYKYASFKIYSIYSIIACLLFFHFNI